MVVVLDNHNSHKCKSVRELLASARIRLMFLPPASSNLNQVEKVWSMLKQKWQSRLFEVGGVIDHADLISEIEQLILDKIVGNTQRIANGGRNLWLQVLQGNRV